MSIVLDRLTKRFGTQIVVDEVSLEVTDGELFVLLGASGSGKSTILRMIAGLTPPDHGQIWLHGQDVTAKPPQRRGTGFVFQNYSIFRHMSVADNIEFGLKIRKVPATERASKRDELLDLVALAYEPSVLLLDEPFGALDVKIRAQLRRSLKQIQRRLRVTTILVTHDQEEAFELADRIGVMERGHLLEVGEGETLYTRPKSLFVATFLGAGTVLAGQAASNQAHFGNLALPIPSEVSHEDGARVQVLFRPEHVVLTDAPPASDRPVVGQGVVIEQNFSGPQRRLRLRLPRLTATRQIAPPLPFGEEGLLVDAVVPTETPVTSQQLWVSLRDWRILKQPLPRLLVYAPDPRITQTSFAPARAIAQAFAASVTTLGVAENPQAAEALRPALLKQVQEQRVAGEIRVRVGDLAEQLTLEEGENFYEYVMLLAGDAPTGRRDRLSTLAIAVVNRSHVPVFLIKGERSALKRLLICTAGGEPGKQDVRAGGRLARRLGAAVTLLYITREGSEASLLTQSHLNRAAATLRALDVETQVQLRPAATPAQGILDEAVIGDYDLIIMGSHGPSSHSLFSLDDVTLRVLAGSDRPVLVVPPF